MKQIPLVSALRVLLLLVAALAFLGAILFPVFNRPDTRPFGIVKDGAGKPMPGAVLRFKDAATGEILAAITTDAQGMFRRKGLQDLSRNPVEGFALTRLSRNTGAPTRFIFTPLGDITARFADANGKPVPGLPVAVSANSPTYAEYPIMSASIASASADYVSDANGAALIHNAPLGTRLSFSIRDRRYMVLDTQKTRSPNAVRYDVKVVIPVRQHGRLVAPDGKPLENYYKPRHARFRHGDSP